MSGTNANAPNVPEAKKVLVAYFSWSGNTRIIANQIKEITEGELFGIQTAKRYPEEYHSCTEIAKREKYHPGTGVGAKKLFCNYYFKVYKIKVKIFLPAFL